MPWTWPFLFLFYKFALLLLRSRLWSRSATPSSHYTNYTQFHHQKCWIQMSIKNEEKKWTHRQANQSNGIHPRVFSCHYPDWQTQAQYFYVRAQNCLCWCVKELLAGGFMVSSLELKWDKIQTSFSCTLQLKLYSTTAMLYVLACLMWRNRS